MYKRALANFSTIDKISSFQGAEAQKPWANGKWKMENGSVLRTADLKSTAYIRLIPSVIIGVLSYSSHKTTPPGASPSLDKASRNIRRAFMCFDVVD